MFGDAAKFPLTAMRLTRGLSLGLCMVLALGPRPGFAAAPPEELFVDPPVEPAFQEPPPDAPIMNPATSDPAPIRYEPVAIPAVPGESVVSHGIVYDNGWTLRPYDRDRTPFELKISFQNESRFTNLGTDQDEVTTFSGVTLSTPDRSTFDINRGRLIFSGYAIDPRCEYYLNIDYNTVTDQQTQVLLAWINYRFSERLSAGYGLSKLPGTWEWHSAERYVQGPDRSMATTFFRPSITAGVWTEYEVLPRLRYRGMVGNPFNFQPCARSVSNTWLLGRLPEV